VWDIARTPRGFACGSGEPYLRPVGDPADLLAVGPTGPNPHRAWSRTIGSAQIQRAVASSGHFIGSFISMDLSNVAPGGHVISVRVSGTAGTVELGADSFLRTKLLLKSTMVRLAPF
jgi:peptidoglycan hydrolase-like amidase